MRNACEYKKIGDICDIKTGKLDANAASENGKYPFFTCSRDTLSIDSYSYDCECVLIAGNGDLNVKYYNGKFDAYQRTYIITLKPQHNTVSVQYLYQFFSKYVEKLRQLSIGGVIKYIKLGNLTDATIPIPSQEEQAIICSLLDKLNRVIEAKKEQLKELDNLAQAIFYDMFGDPITNNKGWNVAKVIDVVKLQRGYDLPVQDRHSDGNIPIYGANGIVGYHTEAKAQYGIITGRSGSIGDVYMSKIPFWPLNTSLFSVDTHDNDIVFLMYLIRNYDLLRFKQGAGVPTLNRNSFHQNDIIDVPLHLQQAFAEKVQAIERQKELINQSIKDVQTLFDAKMDYYFGD